jgi:hypothetical protein
MNNRDLTEKEQELESKIKGIAVELMEKSRVITVRKVLDGVFVSKKDYAPALNNFDYLLRSIIIENRGQ